ncbi:MAG TPA: hypothetical protein VNF50_08225 [Acidimicrobiales bacterium]|nr:hypothetical protein [Acidimicrobiales bacterium]
MDRNEDIWMPKAKRSPMLSRKGRIGGGLLAGAAGLSAIGLALTTGGAQLPSLLTAARGAQPARLTSTLDSSSKPAGGTTAGTSNSEQSDLRPTSPVAGSAQAEPKDPAGAEGSHTDLSGTVGAPGTASFPVTESGGTTVTVDTGAATRYTQTAAAVVSEATAGTWIVAKGSKASDGSLAATALSIVPAPPSSAGSDWSSASADRAVEGTPVPVIPSAQVLSAPASAGGSAGSALAPGTGGGTALGASGPGASGAPAASGSADRAGNGSATATGSNSAGAAPGSSKSRSGATGSSGATDGQPRPSSAGGGATASSASGQGTATYSTPGGWSGS